MPGVEHIIQTHPEVINAQPSVEFKGLQSLRSVERLALGCGPE